MALAEFWLDTELDSADYRRLAGTLSALPYSIGDLREIERFEVAPALSSNLRSVAGEWSGWDPDFIATVCGEQRSRGRGGWRRIKSGGAARWDPSDHPPAANARARSGSSRRRSGWPARGPKGTADWTETEVKHATSLEMTVTSLQVCTMTLATYHPIYQKVLSFCFLELVLSRTVAAQSTV